MNGGRIIAAVLKSQRVQHLFTLIGGHISPILTEAKALGIEVIDVRDEANAVFAADAVARLLLRAVNVRKNLLDSVENTTQGPSYANSF